MLYSVDHIGRRTGSGVAVEKVKVAPMMSLQERGAVEVRVKTAPLTDTVRRNTDTNTTNTNITNTVVAMTTVTMTTIRVANPMCRLG